ncbi:MAG: phosphoribosylformylglycinamidine synthase subunit PurL [Candidatus Omnitrophica bacterium]|nr:phosphoribosylformylglycinamidine synthase subunit PurL [Candidatus Omnitrophota bacterium]
MTTPKNYEALGLSEEEYQRIFTILGRQPSLTELAMFSVEWSEHCGYIHSKKMLQLLPKTGKYPTLIGEDSGGIIVDGLAIVFKMESHNHPSQVEPKQGAATGVGGIIRDIFTAGARPIALLDSLRFGPPKEPYNKYLLAGVVDGIQFYGNCVGVPTVGGEIYFDESYSGNCLVNVMCIGITKKEKIARAQAQGKGNVIIYAGASTGRDGIGGCSILASQEFKKGEEKRPSVQIGDPFTEKCLIEATLEALDTGYVVGIKDMGAAGLTCASSEMAAAGESGIEIELERVPQREKNMAPWEIMMSESQERMLLCVKKGREKTIEKIFSKWGLNATAIGKVKEDGTVHIKYKGETVVEVKADDLTSAPMYDVNYQKPDYLDEVNRLEMNKLLEPKDYNKILLQIVSSPSLASKEWVYQQYDHMVETNTLVLPGSDAAVLRLKGTNKAIAATTDCNSRYCYLHPYRGAQIAVAEAARNLVCAGAEPAAVTDCLNFGNPKKPERFWQFKQCVEGIASICQVFNLPVVSGNVSFYNESPQGTIFPTPAIGMVGIVNDMKKVCTQYFKKENQNIILLGICKEELGGSEYLKEIHQLVKGDAPELDLFLEQAVQATAKEAIKKGLVSSAHDCAEGGLALALAECCISHKENMVGAMIDNLNFDIRKDALLFGESQSRIILSCSKYSVAKIRQIAGKYRAPLRIIGKTGGRHLVILNGKRKIINLPLEDLATEWYKSLPRTAGFSKTD